VNEGAKTGIYWVAAVVMVAVAMFVAWPPETESDTQSLIGEPLFAGFTDPLAASSLRIVKFDEGQGELRRFEVAKDESTGVWSLPSRSNYPADAADQMQKAANALVGLKVLDIQTENPEDHAQLGVVEPKAETLEVGDEGVGLLVSFRGEKNSSLANLIIGKPVADAGTKRYVRIQGQNPVYVVNLDDSVFSSKLDDWIEKDLLQLSSIDISRVDIQNYDAALEQGGSVALNRTYEASVEVDSANNWRLLSLVKYDEQQQRQTATLGEGEKLAAGKLNQLKNALDELKIADVAAKPKGMSENLKADKDLVSDNEAVRSLAVRGFFPINSGDIISANGEMSVTLNDGVQYVLRFGNVEGLAEDDGKAGEDGETPSGGGANRYLLVTAQVDESKFPAPDLKPIPRTIEELDAMEQAATETVDESMDDESADEEVMDDESADVEMSEDEVNAAEDGAAAESESEPSGDTADPAADEAADDPAANADGETSGEGSATGSGQGAQQDGESPVAEQAQADGPAESTEPAIDQPTTETAQTDLSAETAQSGQAAAEAETDEEKQERLEAAQEKITKENQRKLDERKDRIEAARRRVRELNARFADWYYVIPESTYRQLRLPMTDLIENPATSGTGATPGFPPMDGSDDGPTFNFPGLGE
jgi:hypothetical protein